MGCCKEGKNNPHTFFITQGKEYFPASRESSCLILYCHSKKLSLVCLLWHTLFIRAAVWLTLFIHAAVYL